MIEMKKILFFICLLGYAIVSIAQDDTLGRYPYLFYNNIPEHWRTGEDVDCEIGANQTYDGVEKNDGSPFWGFSTIPTECVIKMHTDDTIRVIGVAYNPRDHDIPGEMYPKPYLIKLYDSNMELIDTTRSQYINQYFGGSTTLDSDYMKIVIPGSSSMYIRQRPLRFSYFPDSASYDIVGDFYVGINFINIWEYDRHPYPYLFHLYELHLSPYHIEENTYRYKVGKNEWTEVERVSRTVPMLFPILQLPCDGVDTVRLVDSVGDYGVRCLSATWDSLPLQTRWVVQLEQAGVGVLLADTVEQCSWSRCGLEPDGNYTVSVSSMCEGVRSPSWSGWSRSAQSDTLSIAGVKADAEPLTLYPNPASGTVRIGLPDSQQQVDVRLYDMAGREVLRCASLMVDVSRLPSGTYTVRAVTATGTYSGRLVVAE